MGALRQFAAIDMNGFKWHKLTNTLAYYYFTEFRKKIRKEKLVKFYKRRNQSMGGGQAPLLNPEEIASIWHFPLSTEVKTETIKRTEAKKLEAPTELPLERSRVLREVVPKEEILIVARGREADVGIEKK